MFEGIKIFNGNTQLNLESLAQNEEGDLIVENLQSLRIYVDGEAKYISEKLEILANGSDIKVALEGANGNEIFLVLKNLNDILLTNQSELPIFEVFDGPVTLASFVTIEDLDAAAAGAGAGSSAQTGDFGANFDGFSQGDLGQSGGNLNGFQRVGNADALQVEQNYQPEVFDVTVGQDEVLGEHKAGEKNIITGTFLVEDKNVLDTHTFSIVEGSITITSSSGVITEIEDEIEVILNPDGTYEISGDFNDLAFGESATISFNYTATDQLGFESLPATFTLNITGTNDQPVIEDINVEETIYETSDLNEEDTNENGILRDEDVNNTYSGVLSVSDDDVTDTHTFGIEEGTELIIVPEGLEEFINTDTISIEIKQDENDNWIYEISGDFTKLAKDETAKIEFKYFADDGNEDLNGETSKSELKTISLVLTGTNDQPVIEDINVEEIIYETSDLNEEDTNENGILRDEDGNNTYSGVLSVSDDDFTDTHTFGIEEGTELIIVPEALEEFINTDTISIEIKQDENDDWIYEISGDFTKLAKDEIAEIEFKYFADDGTEDLNGETNKSELKTISLTLTGTNDQPVISDTIKAEVNETVSLNKEDVLTEFTSSLIDNTRIIGMDDDLSDTHTIELVSQEEGNILIKDVNNSTEENTQTINATVEFSNIADEKTLNVSDLKDLELKFTEDLDSSLGKFAFDYTLKGDFNALAKGEKATLTFDIQVNDGNLQDINNETGISETKTVTIEITGTNDKPEVVSNFIDLNDDFTAIETKDENPLDGDDEDAILRNEDIYTTLNAKFIANDDDLSDNHEFNIQSINSEDIENYGKGLYDVVTNTTSEEQNLQVLVTSDDITLSNEEIVIESIEIKNYDYSTNGKTSADVEIKGDFNSLGEGEEAYVIVKYNAYDDAGNLGDGSEISSSEDGFIEIKVVGTNDQPVIEAIHAYGNSENEITRGDFEMSDTTRILETSLSNIGYGVDTNIIAGDLTDSFAEASVAKYVLNVASNETLSFDWAFDSRDQSYVGDKAFVIVNGEIFTLAQAQDASGTFNYSFDEAGDYTILIGVINNHDNQNFVGSSELRFSNPTGGVIVDSEFSGNVSDSKENEDLIDGEIILSANSDISQDEFENFINTEVVNYENSVLEGHLSAKVYDDDLNDTHEFVDFQDKLISELNGSIEETHNDDSDIDLITTPVRVTLLDGKYTITSTSFDKLGLGDSVEISFEVQVIDSSNSSEESSTSEPKLVKVTIKGTNDSPVLQSVEASDVVVYEQTSLSDEKDIENEDAKEDFKFTGSIVESVFDEDVNDTYLFDTNIINITTSGKFIENPDIQLTSEGTYTISSEKFNELASEESVTISFDVRVTDGSIGSLQDGDESEYSNYETVTIEVRGTNDQPVVRDISSQTIETLIEDEDGNSSNGITTIIQGSFIPEQEDYIIDEDLSDTHEYIVLGVEASSTTMQIDDLLYSIVEVPVYTQNDSNVEQASSVSIALRVYDTSVDIDLSKISGLSIEVDGSSYKVNGNFEHLPKDAKLDIKFQFLADDLKGFITSDGRNENSQSEKAWATATVIGTNDIALLNGVSNGNISEDSTFTIDGILTVEDIDAEEEFYQEGVYSFVETDSTNEVSYGIFTIKSNGKWTYKLNDEYETEINSLHNGENIKEVFEVRSIDGTTQKVTITIHGEEDTAQITGTANKSVVEDEEVINEDNGNYLKVTGTLNVLDADDDESELSSTKIDFNGLGTQHGLLEVTNANTWEYKVDNDLLDIQSLGAYDENDSSTYIDQSYTLYSKDESDNFTITIRIKGTNGAPSIEVVNLASEYKEIDGIDDDSNNVSIVSEVTISDEDSDNIYKAKIIIENANAEDKLIFKDTEYIVGHYSYDNDSKKATLTLTSSQNGLSAGHFEEAIKSIKFGNTSSSFETTVEKNISFYVEDASSPQSAISISPATATVEMIPTNDTPIAVPDTRETVYQENQSWKTFSVLSNDFDFDLDDLDIIRIDSITATYDNGEKSLNLDKTNTNLIKIEGDKIKVNTSEGFDILPKDKIASVEVTYTISDGNETSSTTLSFSVRGINDIPNTVRDEYKVDEDSQLTISKNDNNLLKNDSDIDDGDILSIKEFRIGTQGEWTNVDEQLFFEGMSLKVNEDGSFTFNSNGAYDELNKLQEDTFTFQYKVQDNHSKTKIGTAVITIEGKNDEPEVISKTYIMFEGTNLDLNLNASDVDDGDRLVVKFLDVPLGVTIGSQSIDLSKEYTLQELQKANFASSSNGKFELRYEVSDGTETSLGSIILDVREQEYLRFEDSYYKDLGLAKMTPSFWDGKSAINLSKEIGGEIVKIDSEEENYFIKENFATDSNVWINAIDRGLFNKRKWKDFDGNDLEYENWNEGEPNNFFNEDYVEMYTSGKWNDTKGLDKNKVVAEIKGNESTQELMGSEFDDFILYNNNASKISGKEGEDVLVFNENTIAEVLEGAINGVQIESIEEFNLSKGNHILSNISVDDVIAMTDNSENKLIISGDSNDEIKLDSTQWKKLDGTNEDDNITYVNIKKGGMEEGSVKLLIDENIQVDI